MFSITVIAVGKLKEAFYRDAAAEYEKRLGAYCSLRVIELPEQRLPDDPSPAQIAQSLGFGTVYYFSRVFRKQTGMSPSEYRRQQYS